MAVSVPQEKQDPAAHLSNHLGQTFEISVSESLQERRLRAMKHGDTFAVFDHGGDALGWPGEPEGVFHQDTRYLSHFQLMIDRRRPVLLSSTVRDDNAVLSCDLTNPEIEATSDSLELRQDLLHIRRTRFLWNARVFERIAVNNFDIASRRVRLQMVFASDFSDIFEVRGTRRERRGTPEAAAIEQDAVTLAYTGLDKRRRETRLQFEPAPDQIEAGHAVFDVLLGPGEQKTVFVEVSAASGSAPDRRVGLSSRASAMRGVSFARRPLARPRYRPRTRSSTKQFGARSPTSTCWSRRRQTGLTLMPAFRGSARSSAGTP